MGGTSARGEPNAGEPNNTHNSQLQGPESSSTNPQYEALQKNLGQEKSKMHLAQQNGFG
jgi:hypothetical protein